MSKIFLIYNLFIDDILWSFTTLLVYLNKSLIITLINASSLGLIYILLCIQVILLLLMCGEYRARTDDPPDCNIGIL